MTIHWHKTKIKDSCPHCQAKNSLKLGGKEDGITIVVMCLSCGSSGAIERLGERGVPVIQWEHASH
jgi:Zn ribbon nucleic-acid-binding protein